MRRSFSLLLFILIAISGLTGGCIPAEPNYITAFVGSASKPPIEEAAKLFTKKTGINVYLNFGGSGGVLSQMKLSKTGDLYIPGSPDYIEIAEREGVIDQGSVKILAYLIPAIAVQFGNPKKISSLSDLANPGIKIGIGNPESVCVGLYAIEIFEHNKLLATVTNNIVTYAESCDKTASIVALKAIDAVMGWDVFSAWTPETISTILLKPTQIPRIAYIPASISKFSKNKENALKFQDFLVSDESKYIFKKAGYNVTESEARKFSPDAKIGGEYKLPGNYKPLVK